MAENQKQNPQDTTDATSEIDDKALDQVVGGGLASIPVGNIVKAPTTSSFGGEEWDKR